MSTPMPYTAGPVAAPIRTTRSLPSWTREPLLHFVLLGAVLFGIDHVVATRADDPHVIVVGADVDREATAVFRASRGREPDARELAALRRVWLDNEVLYREGLVLQVDKGDSAIRERVIFKALSVIDASVKLPAFDDASLRAWFEQHRDRYDDPPRYDFQEAVLAGDRAESTVRRFVDTLNHGTPGDAEAGLRVFKGRPHANLEESYGADFARTLETAKPGEWQAVRANDGWRAVRLDATTPARPGRFEALRGVVLKDWTDATLSAQRSAAVAALTKKYDVRDAAVAR